MYQQESIFYKIPLYCKSYLFNSFYPKMLIRTIKILIFIRPIPSLLRLESKIYLNVNLCMSYLLFIAVLLLLLFATNYMFLLYVYKFNKHG